MVLDPSGAMILPDKKLMVVSDLHFEKGSSYARKGAFLPPYDTAATLTTLEHVVARYQPQRILSLGDAFHDPHAETRMAEEDASRLSALCAAADWIWVLGNHDPLPPERFRGVAHQRVEIEDLLFVHEPEEVPGWHVAGHLHPCAVAVREGRRVRRPCFVTDGERLIMPPFGAFTGGLNVLDPAVKEAFPGAVDVYMMGRERVYQMPRRALSPDGAGRSLPKAKLGSS